MKETRRIVTTENDEYICINCCHPSSSLFLKYSDNGIRLTPCVCCPVIQITNINFYVQSNCGKPVDPYIEYDTVLVIINLMLQYIEAYRHFLMNTNNQYCHKLCIIFILCNAYSKWIKRRIMSGDDNIYDLEWQFYECLLQSLLEMVSFMIVLALMSPDISRFSIDRTLKTFCVGSYGNVFAVLSVAWHLHSLLSYRVLTELFIYISYVQAQRALCNVTFTRSILVVTMAAVISHSIAWKVGLLMGSFCHL